HVFRIKSQQPLPPVGQRAWLFFYGLASSAYRVLVGITIILLVAYRVPILGVLMAIGGVVTWLVVPVAKTFKYLALEPELHRKRGRATVFVLAVAALVVVCVGLIQFKMYIETQGILEPQQREVVHAQVGGFVTDIKAHDGQWVKKDDILLVCSEPELEGQIANTEAEIRGHLAEEQKALGEQDPAERQR